MANTFWDADFIQGPICDALAILILRNHSERGIPVSRALVDDDDQRPDGGAWRHIEDMARRGLVVIENDVARLP